MNDQSLNDQHDDTVHDDTGEADVSLDPSPSQLVCFGVMMLLTFVGFGGCLYLADSKSGPLIVIKHEVPAAKIEEPKQ